MKRFQIPSSTALWALFHIGAAGAFFLSLALAPRFLKPIRFNTSLFDILPPSHALKTTAAADSVLSSRTSRAVTIFVEADDFSDAKASAQRAFCEWGGADGDATGNSPLATGFESIQLYSDMSTLTELTSFLKEYRYNFLEKGTPSQSETEEVSRAQFIADRALATAFGSVFTLTDLDLENDPFLLTESAASRLLSLTSAASSLSPKDGVLATEHNGKWYVLIRAVLTPEGTSLTNKKSAVKTIYDTAKRIEQEQPVRFIYSGVPFHSYESSSSAQKEITIISIAGLILIIAVFLWIFRSLIPAVVSALAILVSSATALAVTLLIFREVHVLTFVFGTTLIGTCIDYSIHFFVNWKANAALHDGTSVRNHIFRGISLSFISTEICFAALLVAPFPLLKQVSVFLFTGLLSSFLSVICLYQRIPLPKTERSIPLSKNSFRLPAVFRFFPAVLTIISLLTIAVCHDTFKIYNDLRGMYSMSAHLLENEALSARLLNSGASGSYFLVEGSSEEEVLQKEEQLTSSLTDYLAVSTYLPSKKSQKESFDAASPLLSLAESQYEALGFSDAERLSENLRRDYEQHRGQYAEPPLPAVIASVMQNLWIGTIGSSCYSCVMPLHTTSADDDSFKKLAASIEGVTFVNKVSDIGTELDNLTRTMLLLLAASFIAVIIILSFIYPAKTVARIAAIPLIVSLSSVAALCAFHLTIGFFAVTSLVLVFGLGLDYIIYTVEGQREKASTTGPAQSTTSLTSFAILLSFITTALSFGVLAFTSFAPVHIMGLTVSAGLIAACTTAFAFSVKKR